MIKVIMPLFLFAFLSACIDGEPLKISFSDKETLTFSCVYPRVLKMCMDNNPGNAKKYRIALKEIKTELYPDPKAVKKI